MCKLLNEKFPNFYHQIAKSWSSFSQNPITPASTKMQLIWFNKFIKINNKPVKKLFNTQLFVGDLFQENKLMFWQCFKQKFDLANKDFFKWRQIINAIPREWKNLIEADNATIDPPNCQHLLHLTREPYL